MHQRETNEWILSLSGIFLAERKPATNIAGKDEIQKQKSAKEQVEIFLKRFMLLLIQFSPLERAVPVGTVEFLRLVLAMMYILALK